MTTALVQKLSGVRDLTKILETTVKDFTDTFNADSCQILLTNPLDPNVTSLCEFRGSSYSNEDIHSLTIPLALHGRTFGSLSINRHSAIAPDEVNSIRIALGELGDIVRHAQINDVVQRDTFRETFLVEIGNVMAYSLGIGDALFMVVNILGKVLKASRCLFISTDDTQAGWKCYEYCQQDKVVSSQDYRWPTTDSPVIAQTLLSQVPLSVFEGQINSYISPVQEELQFIGAKSLLGIALRSSEAVHGCVILQQCDYRRAWTKNEVDMVQNVADKVAEALVKLPAEKWAREPIMQLHQRIVPPKEQSEDLKSIESVRKALKGALGQQAIPMAAKTSGTAPAPATASKPKPTKATVLLPGSEQDISVLKPSVQAPITSSPTAGPLTKTAVTPASAGQSQTSIEAITIAAQQASPQIAAQPQLPQADKSHWGNLDAIPTPSSGAAVGGLGGAMLAKTRGSAPMASPLMASFHKDKSKYLPPEAQDETTAQPKFVSGPPIEIDEAAAKAKLDQILASSNPTSDYIFATTGLDTRLLGRIDGWVAQIEQKDKYLHGHARQVAEYATAIAQEMGLSTNEITTIRQAALVHDVGKLGSSPQILQKPDEALTDPELITVMKHPLDGAELLESFPELRHLAPIVQAHHEEFDGNGYPQGLKGDAIPLSARIIHIANSYHNMTSEMKYGKGMNPQDAQMALVKGAGKQWDPMLVQALLQCIATQKVPAQF